MPLALSESGVSTHAIFVLTNKALIVKMVAARDASEAIALCLFLGHSKVEENLTIRWADGEVYSKLKDKLDRLGIVCWAADTLSKSEPGYRYVSYAEKLPDGKFKMVTVQR